MRTFSRIIVNVSSLAIYLAVLAQPSAAQEPKKEPTGSVAGRVTLLGKPIPGVAIMLGGSDWSPQRTPPATATTDEDGRFRLTAVPAGSYTVAPHTPALVVGSEASFGQPGKTVTLADGEQAEGIDFSLSRGGVITGRVTDADGRPVIEQRVNLVRVDERGQKLPSSYFDPFRFSTDDRGVYRIYGLMPGRYKVSVGDAHDSGAIRIGFGGGTYVRTFHPDVADESKAAVVEVTAGGEAAGVNIKLGRAAKTFVASGRIVDADTAKPLADLQYGHGALTGEKTVGAFGWTSNRTNGNGEFRIEGLSRGRFAAFVVSTEQVDFYSEPAVFEVGESDVTGLEIKVRRGSSISGLAVIESSNDADALAHLSKLELRPLVQTEDVTAPSVAPIRINADGSFRVTGLRPGKVRLVLGGYPRSKGFSVLRVEHQGVEQRDGIDVGAGENIDGVRVLIGYGSCVVRGQVKIQGGQIAPETRLMISARRLDRESQSASTVADARGRFSLEGLQPGEYEITLKPMFVQPSAPGAPPPSFRIPNQTLVKQNVSVADGAEAEIVLILDLGAKDKDGEK